MRAAGDLFATALLPPSPRVVPILGRFLLREAPRVCGHAVLTMDELSDLMWKSVGAAGAPTSKSAPNASLNQLSATHHAAAAPPRGPGSRRMGDGAVPLGTPSPPISGSSSSGIRPAMGFGAGFGTPPPPAAASGPVSASATALAGVAPLLGAWPSGLTPRLASPDQDRAHRSAATSAPRTPQPAAAMATATATASLVDADPFRRLVPDLGRQPATPPTLAAASLTGIATLRAGIAQPQAQPLLPRMQTGPAMDTPLLPSPTPIARKETSSEPPAPHPYHPSAAAAAWDLDVLERTFTTASRSATPSAVPSDDIFDADFLGSAGRAAAAATAAAATATATVAPPRMPDQALSSPAQAHHAPSPSATPDLDAFLARSPPPPPPLSSSSSSLGAVGAGIKRPVSTPPPAVASPPMAAAARHAQTPQPASAALAFPNGRSRSSVRGTTRAAHDGSSSPAVTDPAWAAHHASMVAMGFDAEESRAALRLHRGDVSAAVESVIAQSARRLPRGASPSPAAGADGLEFPGARLNAVAQAVMADPAQFLQSATTNVLSNARSMFALSKKKLGEMVEKVEQTLQDERDRRPGDAGSGSGRGESEARRREHALSRAQWEANAGVYRDDDYDNDDDGVHGGSGHGDDGESNTRRGLRDNGDGRSKPVAPMPPLVPPLDATATERGAAAHRRRRGRGAAERARRCAGVAARGRRAAECRARLGAPSCGARLPPRGGGGGGGTPPNRAAGHPGGGAGGGRGRESGGQPAVCAGPVCGGGRVLYAGVGDAACACGGGGGDSSSSRGDSPAAARAVQQPRRGVPQDGAVRGGGGGHERGDGARAGGAVEESRAARGRVRGTREVRAGAARLHGRAGEPGGRPASPCRPGGAGALHARP
ncbi:hypothetical protein CAUPRSCDRAFT_10597 [Caulochytrium protostelioides]|uniref:UBA domain-containing protein n=1 Tax=Caulochytrium protostelioides TaxID=1555241 RepID=A0A4V1ITP2_9FUNG|nr:hypothetical protein CAUPRSCDRAFT_10597 [Caulochytrium protostelioides]